MNFSETWILLEGRQGWYGTTDLESSRWIDDENGIAPIHGAVERDPAIDTWMKEHAGELRAIAHQWFEVMRNAGTKSGSCLFEARDHRQVGLAAECWLSC